MRGFSTATQSEEDRMSIDSLLYCLDNDMTALNCMANDILEDVETCIGKLSGEDELKAAAIISLCKIRDGLKVVCKSTLDIANDERALIGS